MSNWRQNCRSQPSATCWLYLHWKGSKVDVLHTWAQQNEGNRWRPVQSTFLRKLHPVSPVFIIFFLLHTNASHRSCTLCHFRLLVCVKTTEQESAALWEVYAAARFYYLVSAEPNSLLSNSNMSAARCLALRLKCDMKSWPMWAGC